MARNTKIISPIGSRIFKRADQKSFARLSGDYNPMHVDAVAARRTLSGGLTVHGLHLVLFALESSVARRLLATSINIQRIEARFLHPVLVGDAFEFRMGGKTARSIQLSGLIQGEPVCQVLFHTNRRLPQNRTATHLQLPPEKLRVATFEELAGESGEIACGIDRVDARRLFPKALAALGDRRMAELLALTRLIGMRCPGLHSILSQIDVGWSRGQDSGKLAYRVVEADERFRRLEIDISSGQLYGRVRAFVRPAPVLQPSMADLKAKIPPHIFAQKRALIVGGSRGLGGITARIFAAGGGHPIITYLHGLRDARSLAHEIEQAGGTCSVLRHDVTEKVPASLLEHFADSAGPLSIYYFATPKIFGRKVGLFDANKFKEFEKYYVDGFALLLDAALGATSHPLRIFYPSSVAIDEASRNLGEYSLAKLTGENLCSFYNRFSKQVSIVIKRLPRTATDQTATLFSVEAEDPFDVMFPIIKEIEAP